MTPYYDRNGITIYCGDCLEVMPQLEPPFDAIVADLPYGTIDCEWDSVIPFEPLWKEYKRLIKSFRAIALTATEPFATDLINFNRDWFKYEWIWINRSRPTGFIHAKNRPLVVHENVLIFSNGVVNHEGKSDKRMIYNPVMTPGKAYSKKQNPATQFGTVVGHRPSHKEFTSVNNGTRYPVSVIEIDQGNSDSLHPSQKPVALMSYLIRTYTNPGELILDNTMGSGTTLVAAQNEGRRAVGIELSEEYCKIAVERLRQPSLFATPVQPNKALQPNCYQSDFQTFLAADESGNSGETRPPAIG